MLAVRAAAGRWPQALDLPTASGKTACIDVAIHALASQSERPLAERMAPQRIWFVVDRRIVVDEAHERARAIANKLAASKEGPLKAIADEFAAASLKPEDGERKRPRRRVSAANSPRPH